MKESKPDAGEPWLRLYDKSEAEHGCAYVRASIAGETDECPASLAKSLRANLIAPLEALLGSATGEATGREDIGAAQALYATALRIALQGQRFEPATADRVAADLRIAWLEFIAAGAGYRMYHDRPLELAAAVHNETKRRKRSTINAKNASGPHNRPARDHEGREVDVDEVLRKFNRLLAQGFSEREARGILRREGVAAKTTLHRITKGSANDR